MTTTTITPVIKYRKIDKDIQLLCWYFKQNGSEVEEEASIQMNNVKLTGTSIYEYFMNLNKNDSKKEEEEEISIMHQYINTRVDGKFVKSWNEYICDKVRFGVLDIVLYVRSVDVVKRIVGGGSGGGVGREVHFIRWFDYVQNKVKGNGIVEYVEIDLDVKREEDEVVASGGGGDKKVAEKKETKNKEAKNKDAKTTPKEPKKKEAKPKPPQPLQPAELPPTNPARLNIRVGRIVDVKQHENADALYVEQIDLGEEQPRTIVSGLVKHIPLAEMQNRMVVVLTNLKPANMRGVKSEGMVLAATGDDGKVELLEPGKDAVVGERVWFDGYEEGEADAVLNSKKKVWETIQPGLFTDDDKVACYRIEDKVCKMRSAGGGLVTVASVKKASIK